MSLPRRIVAGASYLITRRCSERRLFLRPSPQTTAIFEYLLAAMADRYGVLVHAYCVLSNHLHLVVTDPRGRLPDFQRDLAGLLARAVNASLGRWERFWAPDSYSAVQLLTPAAILEKVAYTLANPVAAGLVRSGSAWPGAHADLRRVGTEGVRVARPDRFFRPSGPLPATAVLRLHRPPGFDSDEAFVAAAQATLAEAEARARAEVQGAGRGFLGVARVLAQHPFSRPRHTEPRRGLNPRVASRDKWRRIEALLRLAEFTTAYREAFGRWATGARDVLFPHGTWLMRVRHAVRCAPA
jgi:REP element-mobilizing transposase RayT